MQVLHTQSSYRLQHNYAWLNLVKDSIAKVSKSSQRVAAEDALEKALRDLGITPQRGVPVSSQSRHKVDFVFEISLEKIALELETGQAARVELDILKLLNLALSKRITYACLILPNVRRIRVMGSSPMESAVETLLRMCFPLLQLVQNQESSKI